MDQAFYIIHSIFHAFFPSGIFPAGILTSSSAIVFLSLLFRTQLCELILSFSRVLDNLSTLKGSFGNLRLDSHNQKIPNDKTSIEQSHSVEDVERLKAQNHMLWINNIIYPEQIKLLQSLRQSPTDKQELEKFYKAFVKRVKNNRSDYDMFLKFLVDNRLITITNNSTCEMTQVGQEYLNFVWNNFSWFFNN